MTIPEAVREEIKSILWKEADRLEWSALGLSEKSRYYTMWTETEKIGGRLAGFMDPRQVRVYIKDTLLKSYTRERFSDEAKIFRILQLPIDTPTMTTYIKPHGRHLLDGRQIAWSRAVEWKATLMALHERSFQDGGKPYAAVLFEAATKHMDDKARAVVGSAAEKLGVSNLIWLD